MAEDKDKEVSLEKIMNTLDKKTDNLTEILQKFGMDFITKIGQQNMKINMLTDKIEDLHKAVIDVKGLSPQLSKVIERQKNLENEVDLLKSLIQNVKFNSANPERNNSSVERDETITENHQHISDLFDDLDSKLETTEDVLEVKEDLLEIKNQIFEKFGGHRVLYEISKEIKRLKKGSPLSKELKKDLKEKLTFWKNKILN